VQLDKTLVGSPFLYADNGDEIDVVEYSRVRMDVTNMRQFVYAALSYQFKL
jgi:hypothetical protein